MIQPLFLETSQDYRKSIALDGQGPNIFECSTDARWEIERRLGVKGDQVPGLVGAMTLVFGKYGDDVSKQRRVNVPTNVHPWTVDPAGIQPHDGGLGIRHLRISKDLSPQLAGRTFEAPLARAWVWPIELMEGEFAYASLLRHPLSDSQVSTLLRATACSLTDMSELADHVFIAPRSLEPNSNLEVISGGHVTVATPEQVAEETSLWTANFGLDNVPA